MGISTAQINAAANAVYHNDIFAFAEKLCGDKSSRLEKIDGARDSRGNRPFVCPACGNNKGKFSVNGTTHRFHCFVCDDKGQSNGQGMLALAAAAYYKSTSDAAKESAAEKIAQWPEIAQEIERWKAEHKQVKPAAKVKPAVSPADIRRQVYYRALNPKSRKGVIYANSRGIREDTLTWKKVAFFDGTELYGFTEEQLRAAGLKRENANKNGSHYVMANRIGMPTSEEFDLYGRHINPSWSQPHNYCGRVSMALGTSDAIEMAKRSGIQKLIVVESMCDYLSSEQNIGDLREPQWTTLGTFGTRGIDGEKLVQLVKSLSPKEVVLIPDHDEWVKDGKRHAPGQRSGLARADALSKAGLNVRLLVLPRGMDPNDITAKLKWSPEKFRQEVGKALTPLLYRLWYEAHWFELDSDGGKSGFVADAAQIVREYYHAGEIPTVVARFVAKLARLSADDASIKEIQMVMADILKTRVS